MAGILDNPYTAQAYQLSQNQAVLPQAQPQGFFNNLTQTGALTNLGLALLQSGAKGETIAQGISAGANAAVGSINNFRAQQEQKSQNQINNLLKFGEMDIKAQDLERDSFYRQAALGLQQQQLGMQGDKVNQEKRSANSRARTYGQPIPYPEAENALSYTPKAFETVLPQDNTNDAAVDAVLNKQFTDTTNTADELTLQEDAQGNMQPVAAPVLPQAAPTQQITPQMQVASNPVLNKMDSLLQEAAAKKAQGNMYVNAGVLNAEPTAISGGKEMLEQSEALKSEVGAVKNQLAQIDILNNAAKTAKEQSEGFLASGIGSSVGGFFGGTTGSDLEATLQTVKSNVALDKLMEMKANSSTGASGLGALSEKELALLQSNIANLDRSQSDKQLRKSLDTIISYTDKIKTTLANEYGLQPEQAAKTIKWSDF